jgi:hypothetical protein
VVSLVREAATADWTIEVAAMFQCLFGRAVTNAYAQLTHARFSAFHGA